MKITAVFLALCLASTSVVMASEGPTSIGSVRIGMSVADYLSAINVDPVNCNEQKERSPLKDLNLRDKTLCLAVLFMETGSIETIEVSGISYVVVEASFDASEFIKTIGSSSKAIFFQDRLVSLEILSPKVGLDALTSKYGQPKLVDNREVEVCQNRMGNKFENRVGNVDAIWSKAKVNAIYRVRTSPPRQTCSDSFSWSHYILEEPEKLGVITDAINKHQAVLIKDEASVIPF